MIQPQKKISDKKALSLYRDLLLPRRIEEKMLNLLRQNKISKWFSGIGQEAIAVGVANVLHDQDYILPMHRNLGIFTTRRVDFYKLFCQLFGKADGFTGGRDRSFHFGVMEKRISGMISHLAATMPIADGLGLASKLKENDFVALSFCGDGATSEGDFHEALNLAAVWELPVIFVIENNGYGLSTPTREQFACESLAERAAGYGMKGISIDGNNVFDVMEAVERAREDALKGKPTLIEANTFRMRGHEEASGTFYIPDEKFEMWKEKDPISRYEEWLLNNNVISSVKKLEEIKSEIDQVFTEPLQKALEANDPQFDPEKELADVYVPFQPESDKVENGTSSEKRFVDAIQFSLRKAFEEDDRYIMLGQDIAEYGGVFKVSEGFADQFGKDRIRNTPIIESGAIGCAIGLAMEGFKPVVEIQFADFISCGYNQIVNNLAKAKYRWMPPLNITIRAPHGAGVGAGPFHSESTEGWFMQHPGLKVVVPSTVEDAQNLLYSALQDPNPVLFFEHKKLYRSIRETTPDKCFVEKLGKAMVKRVGNRASIISYGMGVHWGLEIAEEYADKGIEIEVVDLRSLVPLDMETIKATVAKTHKVLLLQEPSQTLGPMSEISSRISEECFQELDAPIMRCSSLDMPIPFNTELEKGYLANYRLKEKLETLLAY